MEILDQILGLGINILANKEYLVCYVFLRRVINIVMYIPFNCIFVNKDFFYFCQHL